MGDQLPGNAMPKVTFVNGTPVLPAGNYGPVPAMLATELTLARSGALDADLSGAQPFYGTDFNTKPLLFLEDGAYYANQATSEHLTGDNLAGRDERDWQLPRPALAVAVPDVVPRAWLA